MKDITTRLNTHNKFVRVGCFLLCCVALVFLYIIMVRKELLLLALAVIAVIKIVRKKWLMAAFCIFLVLLGWVCTFEWTKTRATLEKIHFALLKPYYQKEAEKVIAEATLAEDTHVWRSFKGGTRWFLSKDTHYIKADGHIVVSFVIKYSDVSGYIYLADDGAIDVITEPWKYWSDVGNEPLFSEVQELGGQWMFVRTYRGNKVKSYERCR